MRLGRSMGESMRVYKFRFDQAFAQYDIETFLRDFFANSAVLGHLQVCPKAGAIPPLARPAYASPPPSLCLSIYLSFKQAFFLGVYRCKLTSKEAGDSLRQRCPSGMSNGNTCLAPRPAWPFSIVFTTAVGYCLVAVLLARHFHLPDSRIQTSFHVLRGD